MTRLTALILSPLALVVLVGQSPQGWKVRADRSTSASDPDAPGPIKFVTTASGFHATNPQAAVYWNPANTATGSYSLSGTFTLLTPSNHTNYYGLAFGGTDLDGVSQRYTYFLVAQDGTWLVKRRDGDAVTQTLLPKTTTDAVHKPDAAGQSTNALEVRATGDVIEFLVNGTVVSAWFGAARMLRTDGIYGLRVNHFLDVQIDGFALAPRAASPSASVVSGTGADGRSLRSETMALTGTVGQVISPTAFSVLEGTTTQDVLVLVPKLQRPVGRNATVTVFGTFMKANSAAIASAATRNHVDLPADAARRFKERLVLVATTVLDAEMVDLTKRLPPPPTADDQTLSTLMKRVSPAFMALRQAVDTSDAGAARQNAAVLKGALGETEAFWASRTKTDATSWARTARLQAEAIERGADGDQWGTMKASATTLGQQCQTCHAVYRESFDDGSVRIRLGPK